MARPHKGPRGFIATRAPECQHNIYEQRAREVGLPSGDYAVLVLALVHGFDVPDYIIVQLDPESLHRLDPRQYTSSDVQVDRLVAAVERRSRPQQLRMVGT
ncbi:MULTISPECIES: hypothetical protein [Rhodococcus]|uniref:Uncharacterized protein n=1 Tax=Rhodococcus baikonurensis TaxID=172041 RepID=A0ABV5XG86_9NOCA|nr:MULTISPECIES: hypothetical protein [Rhodococcus]KLN71768.1 hypothetical protein ABM90_10065 [Rhodococcus erythropolis]MBP1054103.1 hypothetical protein [Rhodococcus qingshengii]MCJ0901415.1 hypothetical protein [Rhodococcus sp. ARC_M13]UKO83641.1 hypothetical protein ITJ47_00810 [Rhodococcus erythropolis]BBE49137.1 hypothetical protein RE2895_60680 [Rhodococcus erythropolis]